MGGAGKGRCLLKTCVGRCRGAVDGELAAEEARGGCCEHCSAVGIVKA